MRTFRDSAGRSWQIRLTIRIAKMLRDACGFDLMQLAEGNPPAIVRLYTDLPFLASILWTLVGEQAGKLGVTEDQFLEAMEGDAVREAMAALQEELLDFFRGLGRQDLVAILEHIQNAINNLAVEMARKMKELSTPGTLPTA